MGSQPLTEGESPEVQPLSPQKQLEHWMHRIGGGRATAGKWQAGANGFLAGRFAQSFVAICKREAAASRTRAAIYGNAWALLEDDNSVIQAGLDALFWLIDSARDETPLSRLAAQLGKRAEMVLFLSHPSWGGSWHLDGLRLAQGKNLGVKPLLHRLTHKGFGQAAHYKPLPAVERQALGRLFVEVVRLSTGMIEIEHRMYKHRRVPTVLMTEAYWKFLGQWKKNLLCLRPSMMPMIEPPYDWVSQYSGGFHCISTPAIDIPPEHWNISTASCRDCVLGALNILQENALSFNHWTIELQKQIWNLNHAIGKLPTRDRVAAPSMAEFKANNPEGDLGKFWDLVFKAKQDRRLNGLRTDFIHGQVAYERLKEYERIFFTWRMDRRGRCMQVGGNVGYLKAEPWRAQLTSSRSAPISGNEREFAWAVGDAVDLPKDTLERVTWCAENEAHMVAAGNEPLDHLSFWEGRKEPWRFISLCREWARFQADLTYQTKLFFQLDQSCSAYGHAACLTRDKWLAEQTNCIGRSFNDLYAQMQAQTVSLLESPGALTTNRERECIDWWLERGITRKLIKQSVMPVLYGRSHQTLIQGINLYCRDELCGFIDKEHDNLRVFDLSICLAKYIHRTVKGLLPSVGSLSTWLRSIAKIQMDMGCRPHWYTPNGLLVQSYSRESSVKKFELVLSGRTVRFQIDDKEGTPMDKRKSLTKVTADYVHSMDAAFLQQFVYHWGNTYHNPIVTVHDCMATTLDKVAIMRRELQDQYSRFYSTDHLGFMHYNLQKKYGLKLPEPPIVGDLDVDDIGMNEFLFT